MKMEKYHMQDEVAKRLVDLTNGIEYNLSQRSLKLRYLDKIERRN